MTFLDICKRTHDLAGFQGTLNSVQATGYQAVLVAAVKDTYEDIQRYRPEWRWMHLNRDIGVNETTERYELDFLFPSADRVGFARYLYINWYETEEPVTGPPGQPLDYKRKVRLIEVPYDEYVLMKWSEGAAKYPRLWSQEPSTKALLISPVDSSYILDLHYTRAFDELTDNIQIPAIPERFHQALVYGALMKLSTYIGNPTLYDEYSIKYAETMGQLMREENPGLRVTKRPIA